MPCHSFLVVPTNNGLRAPLSRGTVALLAMQNAGFTSVSSIFQHTVATGFCPFSRDSVYRCRRGITVSNVIIMDNRTTKGPAPKAGVRDRRYAIRYPFAADV